MNQESIFSRIFISFLSLVLISVLVFAARMDHEAEDAAQFESAAVGLDMASGVQEIRLEHLPEPEISAQAYFVRLLNGGRALLERRSGKELPPASIMKILTALVARERLESGEEVFFSPYAKTPKEPDEKMSDIVAGETLLRDDAIRAALVMSANDAASALAETVGKKFGGNTSEERIEKFVQFMNERGKSIGMTRSRFINPHGLDASAPERCNMQKQKEETHLPRECDTSKLGNLTTARDLARLAEHIWYAYPDIWDILRMREVSLVTNEKRMYSMMSTNALLAEYPGLLGGKTGFTDNANGTLILLYPVKTGQVAIIVILGSDDRFGDGRKIIQWLEEAIR